MLEFFARAGALCSVLLACLMVHESGHAFAARLRRVPIRSYIIGIWLAGLEWRPGGIRPVLFPNARPSVTWDLAAGSVRDQLSIYRGGPLANLYLGALSLTGGYWIAHRWVIAFGVASIIFWFGNAFLRHHEDTDASNIARLKRELAAEEPPRRNA